MPFKPSSAFRFSDILPGSPSASRTSRPCAPTPIACVEAVDEARRSGARQVKCCEMLSLCERRLERWRKQKEDWRVGYRAHGQKLSPEEYHEAFVIVKQAVVWTFAVRLRMETVQLVSSAWPMAEPTCKP